ncbi:pyridoxamine 5'-phosphate oxidase family protein [Psychrobacter sp. FDAARGOS_221]|uniref:pyridoxamine 5'-phosphate oxidase family protein n=1 Tax=Psychrobacter sp. FDAARGOS_221 TaxID=1975705 RepID=UPI000BB582D4|nr:pyridoxamine 5'-phosphate oxidase family protein [Psychrobacter sp. FDAARGOS_221]PNK60221.1 general stress protein [Psychrobacter sp. FDAARGOS_221]
MSKQQHIDTVREIVKDIKFAMMTTITSEGHLHACPMTTSETSLGAREVWFIGDKTTEAVANISNNPQVNLSYVNQDGKDYVSINGKAELIDDQDKLDELWSPVYNAFYEHGKKDENIQLIKVVPNGAEYWRSGNTVVTAAKMAAAAVQDGKVAESLGENGSVQFD